MRDLYPLWLGCVRPCNGQRILWRESPVESLRSFELTTLTCGMTSSPYNAIRFLRQCAVDNDNMVEDKNRALTARNCVLNGFFVDNYLESFASFEESVSCAYDVDAILLQGQFWYVNSNSVEERLNWDTLLPADLQDQ